MGLTIHYRGSINLLGDVPVLAEELKDIAKAMGWKYSTLDDDWNCQADAKLTNVDGRTTIVGDLGLKGVSITPAESCETFSFYFDKKGYLRSAMGMLMILDGTLKADETSISVKTQFSTPEIHAWVIGLLKYVKNKYIGNLEVFDEGEYWESENMEILCQKMSFINKELDKIAGKLKSHPNLGTALSPKEIADAIERILNDG